MAVYLMWFSFEFRCFSCQNLGQVANSPFVDQNTHKVTLLYDHGDSCGNKKWKSRIEFVCKVGIDKVMILLHI